MSKICNAILPSLAHNWIENQMTTLAVEVGRCWRDMPDEIKAKNLDLPTTENALGYVEMIVNDDEEVMDFLVLISEVHEVHTTVDELREALPMFIDHWKLTTNN